MNFILEISELWNPHITDMLKVTMPFTVDVCSQLIFVYENIISIKNQNRKNAKVKKKHSIWSKNNIRIFNFNKSHNINHFTGTSFGTITLIYNSDTHWPYNYF